MNPKLKLFLKDFLSQPLVGRPLRKILWVLMKVTKRASFFTEKLFGMQPYVKLTDGSFGGGSNAGLILNYYRTLSMDLGYIEQKPKISILVPVYNPPIEYFKECLQSVAIQVYENWELCIVDDCSTDPEVQKAIGFSK